MTELERRKEPTYPEDYETRAMNLALRLLDGVGSASIHAYRDYPSHPLSLISHGRTISGEFVISTHLDDYNPLGAIPPGEPFPIRIEIVREAPAARMRLVSGSVHMLGTMMWVDKIDAAHLVAEGIIPDHVAFLATSPGGRLGFIDSHRAVVNSDMGIIPFDLDELTESAIAHFPTRSDDLACFDTVEALTQENLTMICDAVREERIDGILKCHAELDQACPHLCGTVVCVDTDPHGISLIQFRETNTFQAFVPFESPVSSVTELREQLDLLLMNSDR